jgi:hypothetical protein
MGVYLTDALRYLVVSVAEADRRGKYAPLALGGAVRRRMQAIIP